ncbi:GTPase IMAP family member 7-like [Anarhichas minor]|uniref:GTPase IMAP family member 7-like n=1 Tax=Anarhichas minor TaxID=65739 RepID=UPI003F731E32
MKTNQKQTYSIIDEHYSLSVSNRRIVILGKTGVGKSSVANTIVGEELFKIGQTAKSETSECRAKTKSVNGRNITLIDTPGLFDTDLPEEELKSEIVKCIIEFSPGLHAFLIVLKVDKFTKQEQAVITEINQYFSEEVFKYATVLFTHGDQLKEEQTIEDFIRDNKLVSDLVKKCGGRCHVIDNKYWKNNQQDEYRTNQFQVKEILNTIEKMIEANKGRCYTNKMLQAVEAGIKQVKERIRQSSGDMSEEEITEKTKDSVLKRILIKLAGITTGALLGALFGLVAPLLSRAGMLGLLLGGVGGAIKGGFRGYNAAEGASTLGEAAKKAAEAVMNEVLS